MKKYLLFIILFVLLTDLQAITYYGAELRTINTHIYGRFEVNYKSARGSGVLSTFFTYHEFTKETAWNEIDIEILGRYSDDIQLTTIIPGQKFINDHTWLNFDPSLDFHTYAFEWAPEYVAWFVDGEEVYRQTGDHISTLIYGQKIMMNIWSSEWEPWVGPFLTDELPFFAYYDWVSYYEYTPGQGNAGTDNNFTQLWHDDFSSWDQSRWEKATHTWSGNRVVFTPDNSVFKDGLMILCLTDQYNKGYVDIYTPALLWARYENEKITVTFNEKVEPVSAGDKTNYSIPGLTVQSVVVNPDQRSVELTVSAVDTSLDYTVFAFRIKDLASPQNNMAYDTTPLIMSKPLNFPVKINVGSDVPYHDFLADQYWSETTEYGHVDGYNRSSYDYPVENTEDDSIYQTQIEEVVRYYVRVPNGSYNVQLLFSEFEHDLDNKRQFTLWLEDSLLISDYDIHALAGFRTATSLNCQNLPVTDSRLDISFANWLEHPVLNGLIIEQSANSTPAGNDRLPSEIKLLQNYPNPFNPQTHIPFYISPGPQAEVTVTVYDITGRRVRTLIDRQPYVSGQHSALFEAGDLASGVYFYRLTVLRNGIRFTELKKSLLIQ